MVGVTDHQGPDVLVFATGGTIGMRETDSGLAPDPDFPEVLSRMVSDICEPLGLTARVSHMQPAIDSANADAETAPRIARAVSARVRTQHARSVVILHGSDTLAYASARLAFDLAELGAPVVVTGSQLPHGAVRSDAVANLGLAIRTATRAKPGSPVAIAFGGAILPAVRATKHSSIALGAFQAELGLAPGVCGIPQPREIPVRESAARVLTLRLTPAITADDLRAAVGGGPSGLVLECYGTGNGPTARPGLMRALQSITAEIPVVAITQCATGGLDLTRYAVGQQLASTGVIDGSDLTVEAAIAKLGFLIDRGYTGTDLRDLMQQNLVGEVN